MRIPVLFAGALLSCTTTFGNTASLAQLRQLYYNAASNKAEATTFLEMMQAAKVDTPDPVITSYKGMAYLLQAKYAYNPYNKLSYFNKGKAMLDQAVTAAPQCLEARFLRLCVQTEAPAFLGYKDGITADRAMLLAEWKNITDADLKERIKRFLLRPGVCSDHEKAKLL